MIIFRLLLIAILVMAFRCDVSYCSQQIVANAEFKKKRLEQIDEFEKNGIRNVIRDCSDTVVLVYSISSEADNNNLIYNSVARPRFKKHHYKIGVTSGVILSQDGIVCTTNTGIMNADKFIVSINSEFRPRVNNSEITLAKNDYKAKLIKTFPELNLAFLRINPEGKQALHYAPLGNDAVLINSKDRILLNNSLVIGKAKGENFVNNINPANSTNNFSKFVAGIEQLKYETENGKVALIAQNPVTNPAIIAETGGGAIFNMSGKLIGIASPLTDNYGNASQNAIPVSVIKKALNIALPGIFKISDIQSLGIKGVDAQKLKISKNMKKILNIPLTMEKLGVKVKSVVLNSLADEAGIQQGDIILTYNGEPVTNIEDLTTLEKLSLIGQTITLKILRRKTLIDIEIYR